MESGDAAEGRVLVVSGDWGVGVVLVKRWKISGAQNGQGQVPYCSVPTVINVSVCFQAASEVDLKCS